MNIRTKEAIRYLGYGENEVDKHTLQMIEDSFEWLDRIAVPTNLWQVFSIRLSSVDMLQIETMKIKSEDLYNNLKSCKKAILFSATLGVDVDRQIHKLEVVDMAHAVVMQACATAYLEEYCDSIQENISKQMHKEGVYLRPRFSPGYGDFSILHQKEILQMLDASKKIGLTMTEGYMLTPTKSITAIVGVSEENELCLQNGCDKCTKKDCLYKRSK